MNLDFVIVFVTCRIQETKLCGGTDKRYSAPKRKYMYMANKLYTLSGKKPRYVHIVVTAQDRIMPCMELFFQHPKIVHVFGGPRCVLHNYAGLEHRMCPIKLVLI